MSLSGCASIILPLYFNLCKFTSFYSLILSFPRLVYIFSLINLIIQENGHQLPRYPFSNILSIKDSWTISSSIYAIRITINLDFSTISVLHFPHFIIFTVFLSYLNQCNRNLSNVDMYLSLSSRFNCSIMHSSPS